MTTTMRAKVAVLCPVLAAIAVLAGTAGATGGGAAASDWAPPDHTITAVTGTQHSGFTVRYHGRRTSHLPTLSEALAECGEYARDRRRVRCSAGVRARYRGLADTKRAIRYARRR